MRFRIELGEKELLVLSKALQVFYSLKCGDLSALTNLSSVSKKDKDGVELVVRKLLSLEHKNILESDVDAQVAYLMMGEIVPDLTDYFKKRILQNVEQNFKVNKIYSQQEIDKRNVNDSAVAQDFSEGDTVRVVRGAAGDRYFSGNEIGKVVKVTDVVVVAFDPPMEFTDGEMIRVWKFSPKNLVRVS